MDSNKSPKSEATKSGVLPPTDPEEFEIWRRFRDPDSMGFDGREVSELDD